MVDACYPQDVLARFRTAVPASAFQVLGSSLGMEHKPCDPSLRHLLTFCGS